MWMGFNEKPKTRAIMIPHTFATGYYDENAITTLNEPTIASKLLRLLPSRYCVRNCFSTQLAQE